ncbi:MAG: hypothetical protein IT388_08115 [Nitrospirales bacterium]|nr:hypothetical protein [Nitrospirales bacterium]
MKKGEIGDGTDPLLTNNSIFSTLHSGYDHGEVKRTKFEVKKYNGR